MSLVIENQVRDSAPVGAVESRRDDRIPVLDALRGLAILMVMTVHFTPDYRMPFRALEWMKKAMRSGWVGVDLFFVLSGFLITGILLRTKGSPHYFRDFYGRRALRILPLYLGALALVFIVVPLLWSKVLDDGSYATLFSLQEWLWFHCANIASWLNGFDALNSRCFNVSHFWSLAVEEHFYLIWPAVVWLCPERKLSWGCGGLMAAALAFRLTHLNSPGAFQAGDPYFLTHFRMDALALGALLAIGVRRWPLARLRWPAVAVMAAAGLPLAIRFFQEKELRISDSMVRGVGFSLVGLTFAGAMIFLLSLSANNILRRLIDLPILRFFGKYSYGLYVLHFLAYPLLEAALPTPWLLTHFGELGAVIASPALKISLSLALAWISWRVLEEPCLRLKRYFPYERERAAIVAPRAVSKVITEQPSRASG